ncbi:counting factor associated protein D-like [Spodoptera litura]|uniref:Counting factor associated protein D-like n=1 Tax=Spodoptera litura TaxID=69820 RepID=A0A9J7IRQ6_SPOLT|nr:counting factor associated protein D-like [Spodoptera litura]
MARLLALLLLASVGAGVAEDARPRRTRTAADTADRWRSLLAEYSRGAGAGGSWFPPAIPVQVPLQGDSSGRASLSVLVVPVPFPVPGLAPAPAPAAAPATCAVAAPNRAVSDLAPPASDEGLSQTSVYNNFPSYNEIPTRPPFTSSVPVRPPPTPYGPPDLTSPPDVVHLDLDSAPPPPPPPLQRPSFDARLARNAPYFPPVADSRLLLEQFRAQIGEEPMLPPVVIDPVATVSTDDYTVEELEEAKFTSQGAHSAHGEVSAGAGGEVLAGVSGEVSAGASGEVRAGPRRRLRCTRRRSVSLEPLAVGSAGGALGEAHAPIAPPPPPPPRFERSLYMRARLTVPRADYTEPYSIWWDAASGAARVDYHGGTTSSYRMMRRDGRVQSVMIHVDRSGETDVRRCTVVPPRRVSLAERALPALPDLQAFSFAGRDVHGNEVWRHTLSGHSGELGGARGEALTFRHELLLARSADNYTTTPLRYSVRVDSSVLGPDCDGYIHQFDEVQTQHHDPSMFHLDIADACEQVEITDKMENVEPLREFTSLSRAPRHDANIQQYKRTFQRSYADDLELAVRKNILMQSSRHVASGNRQGASFQLEVNFLSDRLQAERRVLLGVEPDPAADPGMPFPHARPELDALRGRLPRKFDWRERGAVTHVRNQGLCSSCWAHATVGAVEGALFVQTGRLVPLSEQALVDCAQPYGGNGCKGTWPSAAYNYMKNEGVPALDEYSYKAEVQQCRASSVPPVTRINGHLNVTKNNIVALKVAIRKYGPTVVIIDGETASLASYKSGYYSDGRCRKGKLNHAVLAVGWTVYRGETYFILKNSWSTVWGEEGYVRMRGSTNTCGVLQRPSLPVLRGADVLRVPAAARAAAAPAA